MNGTTAPDQPATFPHPGEVRVAENSGTISRSASIEMLRTVRTSNTLGLSYNIPSNRT
jgi:hypothetical protein